MKKLQSLINSSFPLDQGQFEKIREAEFKPGHKLTDLKYLREKARNERDLRELYRDRAPYELLQNADDAGARTTIFTLTEKGLAFIHDGNWFTVDNFRSLADGWSDKDPGTCIGHKGLGFRSVLDITPSPYLVRMVEKAFFAVKFTWALNWGHFQEAFKRDPSLKRHYQDWVKHGQIACPIMGIPGVAKKLNLGQGASIYDKQSRLGYERGFTTMFWLPARDPDIDSRVLEELGPNPILANQRGREKLLGFLNNEVRLLLPFLRSITEVKVYYHDQCIGLVRAPGGPRMECTDGRISVVSNINQKEETESFFQRRFSFEIPHSIRNQSETPKAIKALKEAEIVLSVRLEDGEPIHDANSNFHVYFPTEEKVGLGFVIHGDFYVKPDRTRLMPGEYNKWLLKKAANKAANEFFTQLLDEFKPSRIFDAFVPNESSSTGQASQFSSMLSEELGQRKAAFLPTRNGLLHPAEVAVPPSEDQSGFWEGHFSEILGEVIDGKKAFLSPGEDGKSTRAFLRFAKVKSLQDETLIDLIESAFLKSKSAEWWYDCYSYMAEDDKFNRRERGSFGRRKLLLTRDSVVIPVPKANSDLVICLPPPGDIADLHQPDWFKKRFVFLDSELSDFLSEGEDRIESWILDRFGIVRFEATELLPRAVRSVLPDLYSNPLSIDLKNLKDAWIFVYKIIESTRQIISSSFWNDIGRLPLPLTFQQASGQTQQTPAFAPCFLAYWPDSFLPEHNCLKGIDGLRRVDETFLKDLISESGIARHSWVDFLKKMGLSDCPKPLKYARVIASKEEVILSGGDLLGYSERGFTGERQIDENRAAVATLRSENLWETGKKGVACAHDAQVVLQTLSLLEGLREVCELSQKEYQDGVERWSERLKKLTRTLSVDSLKEIDDDRIFCRGGGGHSIQIGSYITKQLNSFRWLPSSLGPASKAECFLRLSSRRLISTGVSGDELGDSLIPYVVVEGIDELARLQGLGIELLEDANSASSRALITALFILGEKLSTEWGRQEIIDIRGRWRLVRGAIQEIYRSLNQYQEDFEFPSGIKLAVRSRTGVSFSSEPFYFAEPGSAIERAFRGDIDFLDVDRPYPTFFEKAGIVRLQAAQTVTEAFLSENESIDADHLKEEILKGLANSLLAPIIAKSEKGKHPDLVVRRLKERFRVLTAPDLTVRFKILENPNIERDVNYPNFYLQRILIERRGAVEEYHYVLHVSGTKNISVLDLDGDALGEALIPIFLDGVTDDLKGMFPRIASRYQNVKGNRQEMEEFLYYQLGISKEAQEMAWAMLSGEAAVAPVEVLKSPPPAKVSPSTQTQGGIDQGPIGQKLSEQSQKLEEKVKGFIQKLVTQVDTAGVVVPGGQQAAGGEPTIKIGEVTPEQKERGKRGEDEIKRRLELPGGWMGFSLVSDMTKQGCGYDFHCKLDNREVQVEVKTFTRNGKIVVTALELREAALRKKDYYLVGVLDNRKAEYEWPTFVMQNPVYALLRGGEFDFQTKLELTPSDLFDLQ
jgi:hypothetical protein